MGTNIIGYLSLRSFLGRPAVLDLRDEISFREELNPEKELPANVEGEGLNAYKLAVLLAVGATILSLF
jgi:hypothetical protein